LSVTPMAIYTEILINADVKAARRISDVNRITLLVSLELSHSKQTISRSLIKRPATDE
jgi:hypothetical protein